MAKIFAGTFGLPLKIEGDKKGLAVSTRILSSGMSSTVRCKLRDCLKVMFPAKEKYTGKFASFSMARAYSEVSE